MSLQANVVFQAASPQRASWREWLKLAGVSVSAIDGESGPCFSSALLACEAALEGQGVALVMPLYVRSDLAAGRLVVPFPITLRSACAFYLVVDEAIAARPVVTAFREWIRAEIAPPPAS